MRYLITGGTGLVGSFMVDYLEQQEINLQSVTVLVRKEEDKAQFIDRGFQASIADLCSVDTLVEIMKDIDYVFNFAGVADDWASWNDLYKVNVEGVQNLITAAKRTNSFIIHASSTGVYGHWIPDYPVDESFRFKPNSEYQRSKYEQEKVFWNEFEQSFDNFALLRSPSVIGPRDSKTLLPMCKALLERKFPIVGKGKNLLTFIHPKDFAHAMWLISQNNNKKVANGQAYNLKSFEVSLEELLSFMATILKPEAPPKRMNYRLGYSAAILSEIYAKIFGKKTTLNRYRVSKFRCKTRRYNDDKLRNQMKFEPLCNMEHTIREGIEWLKQNEHL